MDMTSAANAKSKRLTADTLGPRARVTVTIDRIDMETLGKDSKPVMYFLSKEKGLPLNKTNLNALIGFFGPESDDWIGESIVLYTTTVEYAGKQVLGIRVAPAVKAAVPPRPAKRLTPPPVEDTGEMLAGDEIPF